MHARYSRSGGTDDRNEAGGEGEVMDVPGVENITATHGQMQHSGKIPVETQRQKNKNKK